MTARAAPELDLICLGGVNLDFFAEQERTASGAGHQNDDHLVDAVADNYLHFITAWYRHKETP